MGAAPWVWQVPWGGPQDEAVCGCGHVDRAGQWHTSLGAESGHKGLLPLLSAGRWQKITGFLWLPLLSVGGWRQLTPTQDWECLSTTG